MRQAHYTNWRDLALILQGFFRDRGILLVTSDDAEQMALVYRDDGAEGLNLLLEMMLDSEPYRKELMALYPDCPPLTPSSQESLEQAAALLNAMGLLTPADMVAQAAERASPERVLACPLSSDHRDFEWWQDRYDRRQSMRSGRWPLPT